LESQRGRREFIGKRKIDLIEEVLALFYEAADIIRFIRNPFSSATAGSTTRQRQLNETDEESTKLDRLHNLFEIYNSRKERFFQLQSMKYRFMATFGAKSSEPFDKIDSIFEEMTISAHMLSTIYWPGKNAFQEEDIHREEAVLWYKGEKIDVINSRVQVAIKQIERIAEDESKKMVRIFKF
jgi:hypothetical protein